MPRDALRPVVLPFLTLVVLMSVGCHSGSSYVTDNFGGRDAVFTAESDGTYFVRACSCDGPTGSLPRIEVRQGQLIGFRKTGKTLEAFAGEQRFQIPSGREYTWMRVTSPFEEGMRPVVYGGMMVAEIILLPIELPLLLTWHGAS